MSETFFVKIRNRVMGPFPLPRLQQMAQAGKLNHAHEISEDGSNWSKAGEYPEIFALPTPQPTTVPAAPAAHVPVQPVVPSAVQPVAQVPEQSADQLVAQPVAQRPVGPPGQIDWYYATEDEPVGPVTKGEIVEYIKTGDIVRSDRVWNAQMEDWQRAGKRPEFKKAFEQMHSQVPSVNGKTAGALDLLRLIVAAKQWLIVVCGLLFLAALSLLWLFLTSFGDGVSQGQSVKVQQAIFSLVLAGVFAGAVVMVFQFMTKCEEFIKSKIVDDLHHAFIWLNRFWMALAAVLLLSVVFLSLVLSGVLQ